MAALTGTWYELMKNEFVKPYYRDLYDRVKKEYGTYTVYPPSRNIFSAFEFTPVENIKVVIIGQDPYHEEGQANGLCFSVNPGIDIPPSLRNIYKELNSDLGCYIPNNGDLTKWAEQGVFLLNTVLTVRAHAANSHRNIGWETFTDAAIKAIEKQERPLVYILWGRPAQTKEALIRVPEHYVIKSPHPSPLSADRGFFGSRPFSRANEYLASKGISPVDWQIENI